MPESAAGGLCGAWRDRSFGQGVLLRKDSVSAVPCVQYLEPIAVFPVGFHVSADAVGGFSRHPQFLSHYLCPECGYRITRIQCSCGSMTILDCDNCATQLACQLGQPVRRRLFFGSRAVNIPPNDSPVAV